MAAMTRCRSDKETGIPNDLNVTYYSERSKDTGLVLTECAAVSEVGHAFIGSGCIFNDEQELGWKKVVDAVHEVDGRIFIQVFHCGRAKYAGDEKTVIFGPSEIKCRSNPKYGTPKEMTIDEIALVVSEFKEAAKRSLRAGFDGIEIHAAHGYLIDSFIRTSSNQRNDEYGGSVENRSRFCLEIVDAVIEVFGKTKVGIKLSPVSNFGDMNDEDPVETYTYLTKELNKREILFIEWREPSSWFDPTKKLYNKEEVEQIENVAGTFRKYFDGIVIDNDSFSFESGNKKLLSGEADMISYARHFISNPDLVYRFANNIELATSEMSTWYNNTLGEKGYTDYPKVQA